MEIKFLLVLALAVALGVAERVRLAKLRSKYQEPEADLVMEMALQSVVLRDSERLKVLEKALDQLTVQVSDLVQDLARLKARHLESEKAPE
jgi:Mg2+/citrate symporter